jgi:hypothetical protein
VVAVNTAMSSLVKTLNVFPRERTIVTRERARKAYDILPYFGSKCAPRLAQPQKCTPCNEMIGRRAKSLVAEGHI